MLPYFFLKKRRFQAFKNLEGITLISGEFATSEEAKNAVSYCPFFCIEERNFPVYRREEKKKKGTNISAKSSFFSQTIDIFPSLKA